MATKKTGIKKKEGEAPVDEKDEAAKKAAAVKAKAPKKAVAPKKKTTKKAKEEEEEDDKPFNFAPVVIAPKAVPPKPVAAPVAPVAPASAAPTTPVAPAVSPKQTPNVSPATPQPAAAPAAAASPKTAEPVKPAAETPKPAPKKMQPAAKPHKQDMSKHARPAPTPVQPKEKPKAKPSPMPVVSSSSRAEESTTRRKINFNEMMSVKDLAAAMDAKLPEVFKKLLALGTPATINQRLDATIAGLLADAFGFDLEFKSIYAEEKLDEPVAEDTNKQPRPPVVTVMGHVDHGKTSLLDAIRSAHVAKGEAGGITQHIGAYQVTTNRGTITFLDTPGHEAFTSMRARGAKATDLVVLVVAADDSVMPQTVEAIDHAKAAGVPIVVAINKVDLPQANVQKVKQELSKYELVAEDWGGKTIMVEVSAKTGKNIDKLLEMILLETELLELKANADRPARGVVLEAKMDPKRGVMATILIQVGTLSIGDIVVCGLSHGRVRAMLDDKGQQKQKAGPSTPVAVMGLAQVPQVGDQLAVVGNDREAREIAERRREHVAESAKQKAGHVSLETLHSQIEEGKIQELKIILKSDVQGSLEAIQDSLGKLPGTSIQVRFVHSGVGNINESDVLLAEAADAIIFGFNVKVEVGAETEAKRAGVDIRNYKIIYEILEDVKAAMEGLLQPEEKEVVKGRAAIKNVFPSSRYGKVAGCMVADGKLIRGAKARVVRGGQVVATGNISSLKRFKDDVKEVERGYECGASLEGVTDFQAGDIIEVYVIEKHARRLES